MGYLIAKTGIATNIATGRNGDGEYSGLTLLSTGSNEKIITGPQRVRK